MNKLTIWIFSIILIFSGCGSDEKSSNNSIKSDEKYKELSWIELGKDSIRSKLKDGSGAEFRNVFFNNNGTPVSCGEVNSKNSFGAYSGYQRFISAGNVLTILEEEVSDGIQTVWNQYCVKPNLELQKNLTNTANEGTPIVINSDTAKYFVLEKNMKVNNNKDLRSIVTKRVGSSGVSYSKRLYDCKNKMVKYLGTGDTIEQMNKSKEDSKMGAIFNGSVAYEISLIICK